MTNYRANCKRRPKC